MADGDLGEIRRSLVPGKLVEVNIFNQKIVLHVDADVGVGGRLWNASLVLLQYFQDAFPPDYLKGKRILELGSGLGLVGIALAHAGGIVTCTDMEQVLPALNTNIENAFSRAKKTEGFGSLSAVRLEWGEEGWGKSPLSTMPQSEYDIIVGSEIVYYSWSHPDLIWTLNRLCGPHTDVYMTFKERFYDCRGFFNQLANVGDGQRYEVEEIEGFESLGVDELYMFHIRSKR